MYRSAILEELWPYGFSTIGNVTFESAAYVARYIMKKVTGDLSDEHYRHVDPDTGVVTQRTPEFCHMSLKPGIGAGWIDKYRSDVFPDGRMVVRGSETSSARYYDKLYRRVDRDRYEAMKEKRMLQSVGVKVLDKTPKRLEVREKVVNARVGLLNRNSF